MPITDLNGQVVDLYGRKLRDNLRKGTETHLYLNNEAPKSVFNHKALHASVVAPDVLSPATLTRPCVSEIILCDSIINALSFWQAGYRNVTCTYGLGGFMEQHLKAFQDSNIQRVLLAYPRTEKGEVYLEKRIEALRKHGFDCYRIQFPQGMDANDFILQKTPAHKHLGKLIRAAQWLGDGRAKPVSTQTAAFETTAKQRFEQQLQKLAAQTEQQSHPVNSEAENNIVAQVLQDSDEEVLSNPPAKPESSEQLAEMDEIDNAVLPASPIPDAAQAEIATEIREFANESDLVFAFEQRRYRVRGLEKNHSINTLKINLLVSGPGLNGEDAIHVDTLDLYQARPRANFIKQASIELGLKESIVKSDLGKILLKLEALQEQKSREQLPLDNKKILSDQETKNALALLQSPNLTEQIIKDFNACGLVGEDTNILVAYLATLSRKLQKPLAIMVQSTSAAGKSSLMDAVLSCVPEEDRIQYSAMTGQSLFYMGNTDIKHKILAIAEEEGAAKASYALKLLQSEGRLTIASTAKDAVSGKLTTQDYHVEGPVMLFLTTTAIDIDEELLNRCLVLSVNESRAQTQAIHTKQRHKRTLTGLLQHHKNQDLIQQHQNVQRLLKPLAVVNPYAQQLTFIDTQTRTRRDHEKYLTLIDSIALLHQHQREIKSARQGEQLIEYIEVTPEDIKLANQLAHNTLGRTLDELPPQTRKLLVLINAWVKATCEQESITFQDCLFTRKQIRDHIHWSDTALKVHIARLVDLEYLLIHQGGRGQRYVYELLYDGSSVDEPHLSGLINRDELKEKKYAYDANRSGQSDNWSGAGQPEVREQSAGGQTAPEADHPNNTQGNNDLDALSNSNNASQPKTPKDYLLPGNKNTTVTGS